jgi:flavin reductase (DIM6/NTAB) family NADH-FMN oxidoreductase RutF
MVAQRVLQRGELRRVFGAFPTGVTAVCALVGERPVGIAASSFTSVSLDPPLVSVCVAHTSRTWPLLRDLQHWGVSVLGANQTEHAKALSSHEGDRFASLRWRGTETGAVLLEEASAWLECRIERSIPAGDHNIVLLRVLDLDADAQVMPLLFHASQFRKFEVETRALPE